jgi:hypothetical protein
VSEGLQWEWEPRESERGEALRTGLEHISLALSRFPFPLESLALSRLPLVCDRTGRISRLMTEPFSFCRAGALDVRFR